MRLVIRWLVVAASLLAAVFLVPGIHVEGSTGWIAILIMAVVLGFVNAIIRPILTLMSCGLIAMTLGLFLFVINALTFWLAAWLSQNMFHAGFYVDSFWAALAGSIVVSIVSFLLSLFLPDPDTKPRQAKK